ncbi:MAG: type II toxin-antitoxin system Phd/YefM family antitoxin [Thauera sp.]|nr:type II toxin-antitoxin system Phd/YefM family antitoxin [Thauera sp.]
MQTISLADAKAHLSRLVELVEQGEEVTITRRGKPVVRLVAEQAMRQELPSLAELRAKQPLQTETAGDFMRALRDEARY